MAEAAVAEEELSEQISVDKRFYALLIDMYLGTMQMSRDEKILEHLLVQLPQSGKGFSQADVDFMVKRALEEVRNRNLAERIAHHLRAEPGPHGGLRFDEVVKSVARRRRA